MSTPLIIDDQDASHVTYTGNWVKGGTSHEHDGTVMSSTTAGDSFTVSFTGTGITVFATTDSTSGGVVTSYSIDGGTPVEATATAGSGDTYNQQLWKSPTLPSQDHKLVVKMVKVNSGAGAGEGTVWFDSFAVTNDASQSSSSSPDSNAVKTDSQSLSQSTSATPTPSLTSSSSHGQASQTSIGETTTSGTSKKSNTGPIVGGVVGGVLLLLLLLLLLLFLRRRQRKRALENWIHQKPEIDRNTTFMSGNANTLLAPSGYTKIEPVGAPPSNTPSMHRQPFVGGPMPPQGRPSVSSNAPSTYTAQSHSQFTAPSQYGTPQPSQYGGAPSQHTAPSQAGGQSIMYYHNPQPTDPGYSNPPSAYAHPAMSMAGSGSTASLLPAQSSSDRKPDSKDPSGGGLTLTWVPEPIQHVDSGLRVMNAAPIPAARPEELPPVYSAQ
ncbi:hypothetical protein D9613_012283 [Agrocybe pediades]|uniref:Uncharacterized protein n=1 Tax=Agrocybe pediades TaxID=84607 RepID=A0A8H4QF22_9AGAR|nr:hypothetical protein D9613_012283 [Agrocybe pediades]